MRKIILIGLATIIGYATPTQANEQDLEKRLSALEEELGKLKTTTEQRISKIENDLYAPLNNEKIVAVAKASEPQQRSETEQAQWVRINETINQLIGVKFGQSPLKDIPLRVDPNGCKRMMQSVHPLKNFGWFDEWYLKYRDNQLISIQLIAHYDKAYSQISIAEKWAELSNDVASKIGLKQISTYDPKDAQNSGYVCNDTISVWLGLGDHWAEYSFTATALEKRIEEELSMRGKELPGKNAGQ